MIDAHIASPGRLCLLGEHQDYFGLNVLSGAINLKLHIWGRKRPEPTGRLWLHDLQQRTEVDLSREQPYEHRRDYLRSCVNIMLRKGFAFSSGFEAEVKGAIPIGKGTSSSSALVMAWLGFLWTMADEPPPFPSPETLAWLGYEAEVTEFGEPGGMQDHFAMAFGGLVHLSCGSPLVVTPVPARPAGFLLVDSLSVKDTVGVLGRIKGDVASALRKLGASDFSPLQALPRSACAWRGHGLSGNEAAALDATLAAKELTTQGFALLNGPWQPMELAALIREHHQFLRDGLQVSTAPMERLMAAAYQEGALACKVNGSGGGGCFLVYAPGEEQRVASALTAQAAVVYPVEFCPGTGPAAPSDVPACAVLR